MAKVRYFVEKGGRYYWQPSAELRELGFLPRRLGPTRAVAEAEAERLNRDADAARAGGARAPRRLSATGIRPRDGWSGVYVIGPAIAGGSIKIGIAADPMARLRQLQAARPDRLVLLFYAGCPHHHAVRVERFLHRAFRASRQEGEWFDVEAQRAIVAALRAVAPHLHKNVQGTDVQVGSATSKVVKLERV